MEIPYRRVKWNKTGQMSGKPYAPTGATRQGEMPGKALSKVKPYDFLRTNSSKATFKETIR